MAHEQDISFKYMANEELKAFLKLVIKNRKLDFSSFRIKTPEEISIKPSIYRPDFVVEFVDLVIMIEFQSTPVNKSDRKRFKSYVSLYDQLYNDEDKEILFFVVSTVENSKTVVHQTSERDIFEIPIVGLKEFDEKEIINNIKTKVNVNEELTSDDSIKLALTPVIVDKSQADYQIKETFELISKATFADSKSRQNVYGVTLMFATMILGDDDELIEKIRSDYMMKVDIVNDWGKERFDDGVKKGIKKGVNKGARDMALNLLRGGICGVDEIVAISPLSKEEVLELQQEL